MIGRQTAVFASVLAVLGCGKPGVAFAPEVWKGSGTHDGSRVTMLADLRRQHALEKLCKPALIALLGERTVTNKFGDYDLVYWLGDEGGYASVDSRWLLIRTGANCTNTVEVATD